MREMDGANLDGQESKDNKEEKVIMKKSRLRIWEYLKMHFPPLATAFMCRINLINKPGKENIILSTKTKIFTGKKWEKYKPTRKKSKEKKTTTTNGEQLQFYAILKMPWIAWNIWIALHRMR